MKAQIQEQGMAASGNYVEEGQCEWACRWAVSASSSIWRCRSRN